ncbi:MAG: S41 family peptidase [Pseudomonadota bacterium]|nr:S41 family peptidase [Pseudomonadota bacterium]
MQYRQGLLVIAAMAFLLPATARAADTDAGSQTFPQIKLFDAVFESVRANYVDDVKDEVLIENAINGMLSRLDPHSSYLNKKNFKDIQIHTKGQFGGLGIEVTMDKGLVKVVAPIDDTPAFRAGLQSGDYITHLDDEPVMGLTLNEAVDLMRGKVGTDITITVRRGLDSEPFKVTITRAIIKLRSIRSKVIDDIGYIRITTFNKQTTPGLHKAIKELKDEIGESLAGFVLDLRSNPGGLLDQAINVADTFLDHGEIVSTRGRDEANAHRWNAKSGDLTNGLPLIVLIDGGSASASEIVAGALQDHKRAILLGMKTFGKGSVQTIIPLHSFGAMRLTTSRYYTPSGHSIQAKGIDPDIKVKPAKIKEIDFSYGRREADLRGALENTDGVEDDVEKPEKEAPEAETKEDEEPAKIFDYQLERALDLLRGLAMYREQLQPRTEDVMTEDVMTKDKP